MDFTSYTAQTERMLLRPYAFSDFDACFDLWRREEVARYVPWPPRDEAESRRALGRHQTVRMVDEGDAVVLGGFDTETGRLAGEFMLFLRSVEHRGGEIGYLVHPDLWGRGYGSEGAAHMLAVAFEELEMRRVVGRLDARNTGSAGVLRRIGMRHEAHLVQNELFKGEWTDEDDFAILREEWLSRR